MRPALKSKTDLQLHAIYSVTYSYSSGLALMPRSGGAIQPAILPGSVGEVGGHEKRQPVVHGLVEGAQDARLVGVTAVAHQQLLGFLAAVAAKVRVQQVSH